MTHNEAYFQKETKLTVPIRVSIFAYTNGTKLLLNEDPRSHDRQLICYEGVCDPVTVFHLSYIRFPRYYIEVKICPRGRECGILIIAGWYKLTDRYVYLNFYLQVETSQALVNRSSFTPIWKSYNVSFTELELWFRFFFLLAAFLTALALIQSLRGHSLQVSR